MAMDPEKIEETNRQLYELNEAVRKTDDTFKDVLGPSASQIKIQLQKQQTQSANDQNNTTHKLEATFTRQQILAEKQNELFRRKLKQRGYDIDKYGKEIKVSEELTLQQQARLDKLDQAIKKERELVQATNQPVQKFRDLAGGVSSLGGVLDKLQDKMFEMTGKSIGGAIALQGTIAALTGMTNAFSVMTDAIYKGERGASVGAKGAREFSDAVTKAAYGIGAALLILPLGPALKVVGVALAALAAATEGATKLLEMGAKLNDDLYKSYNELSEKGITTAKGMDGLYDSMHRVGIAGANIDKFNKLLGDNSRNMALFGGTVSTGLNKFEKVANAISTPTSELNKQFLLMGINSDAQREHIMKYMTEEDRLGLAQGLSDAQQIAGAKKYIENLSKLSMLTGANRQELEEARATVMANENLRAAIFEAEQDKTEEGKARLAELKRFYETAAMLQAAGDTKGATGLAEYAAGRGITGQASAVAFIQFGGKSGLIERIKKGGTSAELQEAANAGYQRQMEMMADTRRIGGDTSGLMTGTFAQGQEYNARIQELAKKAKELGYSSVNEYIEAENEAKKNSKDKTTKTNVEVRQLQEQTAYKLDDAAKLMDGAALGVASSMKTFNDAVALFTDATNRTATARGITPNKRYNREAELTLEVKNLRESIRIKNKSIESLDPTIESNKAYIAKLKAEVAQTEVALEKSTTELKVFQPKLEETPEYIADQMRRNAGKSPAQLPPGATIPTPPGPPDKKESTDTSLIFGGGSGSKGNFEGLQSAIKTKVMNAAEAFNSLTGKKIKVNSAKRDSDDQQRLWDESVKAGRTGYSSTGMPIGKPGTSKHELGLAIDIQNYNDKDAVAAMNRQGLFQTVPNDPVHFEAARTGAMFEGPKEGYFVQLHGKEFVGNESQLNAIKKLIQVVKKEGLIKTDTPTTIATSAFDDEESAMIIEKFTNMMQSKADELLDKIKFGNRVDEDLLNYSQG